MKNLLRISGDHHRALRAHLFPGDELEAAALLLCGQRRGTERTILTAAEFFPVPYEACTERKPDRLSWKTEAIIPALERAAKRNYSVVKIHSHPTAFGSFSSLDDDSDSRLFPSVFGWIDGVPHASAVMLPGGRMFGRTVDDRGRFGPLDSIAIADSDLHFWHLQNHDIRAAFDKKNAQAFGAGTIGTLRELVIVIIGCSGTGSIVAEQLARLGVGRLVLIDPDFVEEKNLNRILNATLADAKAKRSKVEVLKRAIEGFGLGTVVDAYQCSLDNAAAICAAAECDVAFGCVDSIEGRHVLNRLATFYVIPYFDLGVRLIADGQGGVTHVCGTVNYLRPGGSSLLSRGLYTVEQLQAESLRRTNPTEYANRLKDGYIAGVIEERPAVISVNMQIASLGVNEFLARVHPYRQYDNAEFAIHRVSLEQGEFFHEPEGEPCRALLRYVGRGDINPPLDMPGLSETRRA